MNLSDYIRSIPNFPKTGILFRDITPLLNDKAAFQSTIDQLAKNLDSDDFDVIAGIESRGFIFGGALAYAMGKRFIPIRKRNKLPAEVHSMEYELEYGTDVLEMHKDALSVGDKVVIIDDLLATGGTIGAVEKLIAQGGGQVQSIAFVIELAFLAGRSKITCPDIISLIQYH